LAGCSSIFAGWLSAVKWQCSPCIAWETDLPGWYFNQCFALPTRFAQWLPTDKLACELSSL